MTSRNSMRHGNTAACGRLLAAIAAALFAAFAGCKSNTEIFMEREEMKLFAENAQRAYHAGQYERAAHQAKKALEIDPDYTKAQAILGYTYLMQVRYSNRSEVKLEYCEKAEQVFSGAIRHGTETDPSVFKAYFGLGLAYFMWAQEIKRMIAEAAGEAGPVADDTDEADDTGFPAEPGERGKREDIWSD